MGWNFEPGRPVWTQICDRVRSDIVQGAYKPFQKLPGVRDLAFEAAVNPNTMQRALAELEGEGLIVTRGTSGRFVSGDTELLKTVRDGLLRSAAEEYYEKCAAFGATGEEAEQILKGVVSEK